MNGTCIFLPAPPTDVLLLRSQIHLCTNDRWSTLVLQTWIKARQRDTNQALYSKLPPRIQYQQNWKPTWPARGRPNGRKYSTLPEPVAAIISIAIHINPKTIKISKFREIVLGFINTKWIQPRIKRKWGSWCPRVYELHKIIPIVFTLFIFVVVHCYILKSFFWTFYVKKTFNNKKNGKHI